MNLYRPTTIRDLLSRYGAKVRKQLGQNFLINPGVAQAILIAASLRPSDVVLEVGPGIGTLTRELAERAKQVVAIEKDAALIPILQETLAEYPNVEIIRADALAFDAAARFPNQSYKLVANLPYYITSPLIRTFLETESRPELMVLMVQKEVAQRICQQPPDMNLLALSVQFYADASIIQHVKKGSFWPAPAVDSAVIAIIPRKTPPHADPEMFFRVAHGAFLHPRRQILTNFSEALGHPKEGVAEWLLQNNVEPKRRAETLGLSDFIRLANTMP